MTSASPRQRVAWIDAARGIGILLVVLGHVMRSLVAQGIAPDDRLHQTADALIYAFHMPLFFLLSGLFARPAAAGTRATFLRNRVRSIAYPYVLWSLIQGVTAIAASGHATHEVTWSALGSILWMPIAQFWFLYVLFFCQLLLLLPGRFTLLILVPIGMVLTMLYTAEPMPTRVCYELPFFAAGVYLTAPRATAWLVDIRWSVLAAVGAWSVFLILFCLSPALSSHGMKPWWVDWAEGLTGAVGTLAMARLAAPYCGWLLELGRASMPIYLMHVIVAAALRTVLLHLWPKAGELPYLGLLTLVGVLVPYAIFRIAERFGLDALLGFARTARGPARLGGQASATAGDRA